MDIASCSDSSSIAYSIPVQNTSSIYSTSVPTATGYGNPLFVATDYGSTITVPVPVKGRTSAAAQSNSERETPSPRCRRILHSIDETEEERCPRPLKAMRRWNTMTSFRSSTTPINVYDRQPGDGAGGCNGSGSFSPRERNPAGNSPGRVVQPLHPSPRSAQFMDNFRRRLRQRSLNITLPSDVNFESLDEDLGFPPICTPPPDAVASSVPATSPFSFRPRANSEANPSLLNTPVRRQSGVLVVFSGNGNGHGNTSPQSSSSSSSSQSAHSNVYETTPTTRATNFVAGDPRTLEEGSGINPSPRRPLYVDTQLANGEKKRSPVASVVDFVRGRNRTHSLNLSGPTTPTSPMPMPVSARPSHSVDAATMPTSPLFSPTSRGSVSGGRPPLSRLYQRHGMRSFDSGLDLSSPTIGNTALFIKETSLSMFSSFDSMTIGSTEINAVFLERQDSIYSIFMRAHKCYDLIPTSTKLVVFDTHLPVRKAFYALVYNGIRAAPLWHTETQRFVGMLTITDFIKILIKRHDEGFRGEKLRALEDQQIAHWREQFLQDGSARNLVNIDPNQSLYDAVKLLCQSKVHRLPVLDGRTGNITYILTHKRIIKFLSLYLSDLPKPEYMDKRPRDLGIGSWGDILTIHEDTCIHDALETFLKNRVSALPLVDKSGKVVDIYAKFDAISLAAESSYDDLNCSVKEALKHRSDWFEGVRTCRETDSLLNVVENIVKAEVHRLIVVDDEYKPVGIISLSDILKYLVLDCDVGGGELSANGSAASTQEMLQEEEADDLDEGRGGSDESPPITDIVETIEE